MTIQTIAMTKEDGKRNVKVANAIRTQMYNKLVEVVRDAGFDVQVAANGEIAITTCVDATSGSTYYTRLKVSLSDKSLDAKTEKKPKAAKTVDVEIPELF